MVQATNKEAHMPLFINRVFVAGNLTRDVESRNLGNDQTVASFGIAVNRRYKGRDGQAQEEATFLDVECWGRTAELAAQYLEKGRNVHIEGRLKMDQWEDKNGGGKRSKLKIVADQIHFVGGRDDAGGGGNRPAAPHGDAVTSGGARVSTSAGDVPAGLGDDEPPF
jgi:single-strand DNA-binding protein